MLFFVSCSTQKQLNKQYIGISTEQLKETFGEPKTILNRAEDQLYIFEKEEELESTEISQGKLTLDPIVTPKVKKFSRYYFTVKNNRVVSSKFEEEYER